MPDIKLADGFVYLSEYYKENIKTSKPDVSEIEQHLRYAGTQNFTGSVVKGYTAANTANAVITKKAAEALYNAQQLAIKSGYSLMIYDTYRPQKAVNYFVEWAEKAEDCEQCKQSYYPMLKQKTDAFELPDRYIAKQSGHSRGSTVDLTLIKLATKVKDIEKVERTLKTGQKVIFLDDGTVDMWTSFDLFDKASWHNCTDLVEDKYLSNRNMLKDIMTKCGFEPLEREWWHYTLKDEPFPNTYFDFDF